MCKKISLAMLLVLSLACSSYAATYYVAAGASGTGVSWADPYGNLEPALLAAVSSDTVLVAEGTYVPTGASFSVAAGVTLKGGYSNYWDSYGTATLRGQFYNPKTYRVVLSGDTNGDDAEANLYGNPSAMASMPSRADNKTPILSAGAGASIDGCVFYHGDFDLDGTSAIAITGGGAVSNCEFQGNMGDRAVYVGAGVTITSCYFEGNAVGRGCVQGNGNLTVTKCSFKGNSNCAEYGNGIYWSNGTGATLTVTDCLTADSISGATSAFGTLYISGSNTCTSNVSRCVFLNDEADACSTMLENKGNPAVQTHTLTNCLWANCEGNTGNGTILMRTAYPSAATTINITNCTVADCKDAGQAGLKAYKGAGLANTSLVINIKNSIIWGNSGPQVLWDTTGLTFTDSTYNPFNISYSCIDTTDPNNYPAFGYFKPIPTGLIVADPQFKGSGDYHLASTSPCIDKGDPASSYVNEPKWLNGCRINMGAYGNTAEAELTTCSIALTADATGDCKVGNPDLLTLRNQWNKSCPGSFP